MSSASHGRRHGRANAGRAAQAGTRRGRAGRSRGTAARKAARAPMAVRAALMAAAGVLAVICALAVWNAFAASSFNGVTASLQANMTAAQADDADLDALATSQRQVDAQFADLTASSAAQWPGLRDAVRANADASAALSADLAKRIAERDAQSGTSGSNASGQSGASGQDQSNQGDGSADKKLDELLSQNDQQPASGQQQDGTTDSTGGQDPNVKPW